MGVKQGQEVDEDTETGESDPENGRNGVSGDKLSRGTSTDEEEKSYSEEGSGRSSDEEDEGENPQNHNCHHRRQERLYLFETFPLKPPKTSLEHCELFRHTTLFSVLTEPHSFRTFGPLRYARITMNHETSRSRGTDFVCFWNVEDDKAIEKSELLHLERWGQHLRYALLCGAKRVGSANILSLGQVQSVQAPVDINPRSVVEPGPGPGSARQDVGCRTGGHQERGNETEGRRGEETGEGGQEKCVPALRRRYGLMSPASGQFAYMFLGQ